MSLTQSWRLTTLSSVKWNEATNEQSRLDGVSPYRFMNIDQARHFILHHQEAELREHPQHARWIQAVEVVEAYKRAQASELAKPVVLENPRFGRMRR